MTMVDSSRFPRSMAVAGHRHSLGSEACEVRLQLHESGAVASSLRVVGQPR